MPEVNSDALKAVEAELSSALSKSGEDAAARGFSLSKEPTSSLKVAGKPSKPLNSSPSSVLTLVQTQIANAATRIGLNAGVFEILSVPKNQITINFPVKLSGKDRTPGARTSFSAALTELCSIVRASGTVVRVSAVR